VSANARVAARLVLLCATLSLAWPAGAAAQPLVFGACSSTQVVVRATGLQCATLDVPFDRSDASVGDVALAVQRVPASAPRAGVIVLLAGGPGQPALPAFEGFLAPLARDPALRGFELVAFDQRGTGQSEALECPEVGPLKGGLASYVGACGTALGPTRAYYTSQESVEDLDALRESLGGTPLSLLAVSYGTRVAGMYAREYPQGVARMVLDSLVPTTGADPLGRPRIHALRRVLDEGICGAGACRSFSTDVYGDLTRLVKELRSRPLHTRIYNDHGRLVRARVTQDGLLRLLDGLDLAAATRELAPAAIAAAARGDAAPLARLTDDLQSEPPDGGVASAALETEPAGVRALRAFGEPAYAAAQAPLPDSLTSSLLYTATYCVESDLPWSPESPLSGRAATLRGWLASLPAAATAPFSVAVAVTVSPLPTCMAWPPAPAAPPSPTGVSATPTLILSGDDDLRTPYEQDLASATDYSDVRLLRIPDVGHSTVSTDRSGCAENAMIEFLAIAQIPGSCPPSAEPQALPLPPSSLTQVAPDRSHPRPAGQVASAAAITLEDLFGQTSLSGGGLRGGDWSLNEHGYKLHEMVDVPGVVLSGAIHVGERGAIAGHLLVRGRLAGELTLSGRSLSGRVGGVRVRARLVAL
jgi:pimeloyl-ACP methyl ester carboxylesterase